MVDRRGPGEGFAALRTGSQRSEHAAAHADRFHLPGDRLSSAVAAVRHVEEALEAEYFARCVDRPPTGSPCAARSSSRARAASAGRRGAASSRPSVTPFSRSRTFACASGGRSSIEDRAAAHRAVFAMRCARLLCRLADTDAADHRDGWLIARARSTSWTHTASARSEHRATAAVRAPCEPERVLQAHAEFGDLFHARIPVTARQPRRDFGSTLRRSGCNFGRARCRPRSAESAQSSRPLASDRLSKEAGRTRASM